MSKLVQRLGYAVVLVAAVGCGDDDDGSGPADGGAAGSPAPASGKALSALTASELEGLCGELLGPVKSASTPEQLCTEAALSTESTASACDTERKACLEDKTYQDFSKVRCADFTSSTAPKFDCNTKVSEVTSCYDKVATWLKSLRCAQAGKAAELPDCIDELDADCDFGLSKLISDDEQPDGNMSCDPGDYANCTCTGGSKGTQRCNDKGTFDACVCGEMPSNDKFVCRSGSKSYPYDFGGGSACNECATDKCCSSFVDCENDTACACYWTCIADPDIADCEAHCKVSDIPEAFVDHAVCLADNCSTPCDVKP
ncbi:MAG TPA: hypothetical protein VJR89_06205 [Polyangiales bacterium]|nr:hypothetical protein [Polyangiales bacterium]